MLRGSSHDYALYKRSHPWLSCKVLLGFDLGYLGVKGNFFNLNCVLPFKKKNSGRGKVGVRAQGLLGG